MVLFRKDPGSLFDKSAWPFFFFFIELLLNVIKKVLEIFPKEMIIPFIALFLSHGFSFVYNFFIKGEYRNTNSKDQTAKTIYKDCSATHCNNCGSFTCNVFRLSCILISGSNIN